jgi:hypothetical protein
MLGSIEERAGHCRHGAYVFPSQMNGQHPLAVAVLESAKRLRGSYRTRLRPDGSEPRHPRVWAARGVILVPTATLSHQTQLSAELS